MYSKPDMTAKRRTVRDSLDGKQPRNNASHSSLLAAACFSLDTWLASATAVVRCEAKHYRRKATDKLTQRDNQTHSTWCGWWLDKDVISRPSNLANDFLKTLPKDNYKIQHSTKLRSRSIISCSFRSSNTVFYSSSQFYKHTAQKIKHIT